MSTENWNSRNHDRADSYVSAHEEETRTSAVIDCGGGVYALLPKGLPALHIRFPGLFMIAPLPLLMACVLFLPLSGFLGEWEVNTTTLGISAFCLVMIAGLVRVILFMLNNRDLFPRNYFVTLGPEGLAMHFSRFHFPSGNPRAAIAWKDVDTMQRTSTFFFPSLLLGRPRVPALQVNSKQGEPVVIPLDSSPTEREKDFEHMETLIRENMNR